MHKHFSKFLQSVVVIPLLATSFAVSPFPGATAGSPTAAVISPDQNRTLTSEVAVNQQSELDVEAAKVDAFFAKYDRPLEGYGRELVSAATKNGLPPYAVAALAQVESSGFEHVCPNDRENGFGYNSCHGTNFDSITDAIDTVALTISGHSPGSSRYYANKSFETKLLVYNGRANPDYVENVMWVMNQIAGQKVAVPSLVTGSDAKA